MIDPRILFLRLELASPTTRMDPRQVETQNTLAVRRFSLSQEAKAEKERNDRNERKGEGHEQRAPSDKESRDSKGGVDSSKKQSEASGENRAQIGEKDKNTFGKDENSKPTLRVLAYSDSDSDVEDHFESVKTHLLPAVEKLNIKADTGNKKVEKKEEVEVEAEANKKPVGTVAAGQLLSKISSFVFGAVLTGPVIIGGAVLAGLESRVHPRAAQGAELAGVSIFLARLAQAAVRGTPLSAGGVASRVSDSFVKASVVYEAFKWLVRQRQAGGEARRHGQSYLQRLGSHIQLDRLSSTERVELGDEEPTSMNGFAAAYNPELREMRRILDACEVTLPARFDEGNEELFRFAKSCGILQANGKEERAACVERAIRRVIHTVDAMVSFKRMPDNRLKRWERVVSWRGITPGGRPVLVVRLGRAMQLTQNATNRLDNFIHAIKTQVDVGIETRMERSKFGTMVVVVDCGEITAWEAISNSRHLSGLAKSLTLFFTTHYPERLERAYLVDASMMVNRMFVSSIISTLDGATKDKIVSTTNSDESLPVTLASLQKARSIVAGLSSVISDPTTCGSTAGDSDGELQSDTATTNAGSTDTVEESSGTTPATATATGEASMSGTVETSTRTPDVSQPDQTSHATLSTGSPADKYHTPYIGDESEETNGASDGQLGSHALRSTPSSHASIRGKLFSTESSVDSLDVAPRLGTYPWSGLDLMLALLLQPLSTFIHPARLDRSFHRPAISPTMRASGLGFRRDSGLGAPMRGGLLALPPRPPRTPRSPRSPCDLSRPPSATSATASSSSPTNQGSPHKRSMGGTKVSSPTKPSLRRESSMTEEYLLQRDTSAVLGSYPLPRQSSVSWAETLVNVREIDGIATIEWTDERISELIHTYAIALLLTARVICSSLITC